MFVKLIAFLLGVFCLVQAQCPPGTSNYINGYTFRYCYTSPSPGFARDWNSAVQMCQKLGYRLVMPKTDWGLVDLINLNRAFANRYFWVTLFLKIIFRIVNKVI